jgi:hypothetical protein
VFTSGLLSTVFFKLLNVAVFFLGFYYIFKRYFLTAIREKMAQKDAALLELDNTYRVIVHERKKIITEKDSLAVEAEYLLHKAQQWQQGVIKRLTFIEEQKAHNLFLLKARRELQSKHRIKCSIQYASIPAALAAVRKKLANDFDEPEAGLLFIDDMCKQLKRGMQ